MPWLSLAGVEAHIEAKKSHSGHPTAAGVAAAGVNLGEMQAKLVQKREELTQRQITHEKQPSSQQDEIRSLAPN